MRRILGIFCAGYLMVGICFGVGEINIAYSPYTISKPGSYIVVKDLNVSGSGNGITISTSGVTIDLNGHGIYGPGTLSINTGNGIESEVTGMVTICNGQISNFTNNGIALSNAHAYLSKLKVTDNAQLGIMIDGGLVENCIISHNGYNGIATFNNNYPALIRGNEVSNNCWDSEVNPAVFCTQNCEIINNTISNNSSDGVFTFNGNLTITNNVIDSNYGSLLNLSGIGIFSYGSNCQVTGNVISKNQNQGINIIANGSSIKGNYVSNNGNIGILVIGNSQIIGNTLYSNVSGGIQASNQCTVKDNDISSNNVNGILVDGLSNNIQNNSIYSNTTGLNISNSGNFWGGNILRSNTISTSIASGNTVGNGVTGGFNNLIVPYSDINFGIRQLAGFDMTAIQDTREAGITELKW